MPKTFERYGTRLQQLHPDWEFMDWRSSDQVPRDHLITLRLFDIAKKVCPNDWKRYQADLLRLELLYRFGGVYVDADVEPLRPFDSLLDDANSLGVDAFVPYSPNRFHGRRLVSQFVMGAEPGSEFVRACIDAVPHNTMAHQGKPLAQVVGPHMIDRVLQRHGWNVMCLPEAVFHPPSATFEEQSVGHHRWNSGARRRGQGAK